MGLRSMRGLAFVCLIIGAPAIRTAEDNVISATPEPDDPNYFQRLMEEIKKDPFQTALTLKGVVDGVTRAIGNFNATPPEYDEGFGEIRNQMWNVFDVFAKGVPEFKASEDYTNAQAAWNDGMKDVPDVVKLAVDDFQENGNLTAFSEVVNKVVEIAQSVASQFFPTWSPVFEAYGSLMLGVSDAWVAFDHGNTGEAVSAIWVAFNSSIVVLVGKEEAQKESFKSTMVQLDSVVTTLITELIDFRKAKIESKICYRIAEGRTSRNPTICESKRFEYDGKARCYPDHDNGWDCESACRSSLGKECEFCPKEGGLTWCCKPNDPDGPEECSHAGFVNHSFTEGNAEDYYQCMAPLAVLAEKSEQVLPETIKTTDEDVMKRLIARQHASLAEGRETSNMDSSFNWKCIFFFWRRSCQTPPAPAPGDGRSLYGSHPARCDEETDHKVRIDDLCYSECDANWSPVMDEEAQETPTCMPNCHGDFPHEGRLGLMGLSIDVCSFTEADLNQANVDLVNIAKNVASAVAEAVKAFSDADKDFDAPLINNVLTAFGDLAAHFNRPVCE